MKVLYVYNSPRKELWRDYLEGNAPDDFLYGLNHMEKHSINAYFTDRGYKGVLKKALGPVDRVIRYKTSIGFNIAQGLCLLPELRKCDLIFSTVDANGLPIATLRSASFVKTPQVYVSMGLTDLLRGAGAPTIRLYRWIFSSVDRILCLGNQELETFNTLLQIPKSKLYFVPFGVDQGFFTPERAKNNEEYILSFGADPNRDYGTLIKAAEDTKIKLKIVTYNPNLLKGIKIPENVEVIPRYVSFKDLKKLYANSLFVVVPLKDVEYTAGQSVTLEAMAMEKTVIMSRIKGLWDNEIKDRKEIVLVKPSDVSEMKDAINYLLNNPEEADKIGKNARKVVENRYNSQTYAKHLAMHFKEVYEGVEI